MRVKGTTRLIGILGDPVSHSLSPGMHNAAYHEMGLDICYVPLHVAPEALEPAIKGLRAMQFLGANVTIPHKVKTLGWMDDLADSAIRSGAVNTIVNEQGRLIGHNTDGVGFLRALEEQISVDFRSTSVLLSGAGGAARAVCVAVAQQGVPQITLINRSRERAEELKSALVVDFPALNVVVMTPEEQYGPLLAESKLVVNTTPLGMSDELKRLPLRVDSLSKDHVVCDIVYTRSQETPLLVAAQEKGATILGGLGMLLHQGAVAINLWTSMDPPIEVMRRTLEP
ncbi:MAG: shikimate dehydrogenase [Thermoleophilia bacterium]